MKTLKNNRIKLAAMAVGGLVLTTWLAAGLLWGQTAPGLSIIANTNLISLTVTNGTTNGQYQIYFAEFMDPTPDWVLLTNGAIGQTNFTAYMGDLEQGYFKAINNTNFLPPSIVVVIQSPLNGSLVY